MCKFYLFPRINLLYSYTTTFLVEFSPICALYKRLLTVFFFRHNTGRAILGFICFCGHLFNLLKTTFVMYGVKFGTFFFLNFKSNYGNLQVKFLFDIQNKGQVECREISFALGIYTTQQFQKSIEINPV